MILVVEDEFVINSAITQELQQHGCEVVSPFNADEAISILQSRSDIEVVFTDIDMRRSIDGLRLAAAIPDRRWLPVHVIAPSGKTTPIALPDNVSFIAKP